MEESVVVWSCRGVRCGSHHCKQCAMGGCPENAEKVFRVCWGLDSANPALFSPSCPSLPFASHFSLLLTCYQSAGREKESGIPYIAYESVEKSGIHLVAAAFAPFWTLVSRIGMVTPML
jgi:hypothetical protein